MDAVLAIDTGGTKCDALLVATDGTVIGWGHSERQGRGGRSADAVREAAGDALTVTTFDRLVLCTVSTVVPTPTLSSLTFQRVELHHCAEETAAMRLAGVDHGLMLLAGTGSFAVGIDRRGNYRKVDGMGPILGDDGSGYQIGQLALRAVVRTCYHPRHKTLLRNLILAEAGVTHPRSLLDFYLGPHDRSLVAKYARFVDLAARQGDRVAMDILETAAGAFAANAIDVLDLMKMRTETFPCVGFGSVICGSDHYWHCLTDRIRAVAPGALFDRTREKPIIGMAIEGLHYLHTAGPSEIGDLAQQMTFEAVRTQLLASAAHTPFLSHSSASVGAPSAPEPTPHAQPGSHA